MSGLIKAFHVIGLILWMGGLFQLARHLMYHADLPEDQRSESLADWESKTYYMTVLPGFIISISSGLYSMFELGFGHYLASDAWGGTFHLKLLLVVILIGADQFLHFKMRKLHKTGEGRRGPFLAVHILVGLSFVVIPLIVLTRVLA